MIPALTGTTYPTEAFDFYKAIRSKVLFTNDVGISLDGNKGISGEFWKGNLLYYWGGQADWTTNNKYIPAPLLSQGSLLDINDQAEKDRTFFEPLPYTKDGANRR